MTESIKYDSVFKIEIGEELYTVWRTPKQNQKTITISKGYFKATIKVEDIKISPKSYWEIKGYDHQFEGSDANCWLCGWYGMDYGKCKCKKSFSIQEHPQNLRIARKNYLVTLCKNYFPEYVKQVKTLDADEVGRLLFDDSDGVRKQKLYFPHWSNRAEELEPMKEHLKSKLEGMQIFTDFQRKK